MHDQKPTLEYPEAYRPRFIRHRINWPYMAIAIALGVGLLSFWWFLIWSALGWTNL